MKKYIAFVFLFVVSNTLGQWSEIHNTRIFDLNSDIQAKNFIHHSQGNLIVCGGGTYIFGQNQYYAAFVMSIDTMGAIHWSKTFTTFTSKLGFNKILELSDGNIILGGFMQNPMVNKKAGLLVSMDINGQILWQKSIGNSLDVETHVNDLVEVDDSTTMIVGSQYTEDGNSFVASIHNNGQMNWVQSYQNTTLGRTTCLKGLARNENNTYLMVGSENVPLNEQNGIVLKIDSVGQILFALRSQEMGTNYTDVLIDSSQVYVRNMGVKNGLLKFNSSLALEWNNYINDSEWSTFESNDYLNRRLCRLDTSGIIYSTSYFSYGSYHLIGTDGETIGINSGAGGSEQILWDTTGVYYLQSGPSYGVKSGQELFNQHFALTYEDSWNSSVSNCIGQDFFNNHFLDTMLILDTFTLENGESFTLADAMLEEVSVQFTSDNNCVEFLGNLEEIAWNELIVFPNPSKDNIYVEYGDSNGFLSLYNMLGAEIGKYKLKNGKCFIPIVNLSKGYYILQTGPSRTKFYKN